MYNDRLMRFRDGTQQLQDHHDNIGYAHLGVMLVIALATLYVIYKIAVQYSHKNAPQDPISVAKSRFAAGEITNSELADIAKTLKG